MKRLLILLALVACPCFADPETFYVFKSITNPTTSDKVTIQQSAATVRPLVFVGMSLYCSAAGSVAMDRTGTAATTTAVTPSKIDPRAGSSSFTAYTSSNAGSGTAITTFHCAAGETKPIDLSLTTITTAGGQVNFTPASMTGTMEIFLMWREQ